MPYSDIARLLKEEKVDLLDRWARHVRHHKGIPQSDDLSRSELIDHLPQMLDLMILELNRLSRGVSTTPVDKPSVAVGRIHGRIRAESGYTANELVEEMAIFRRLIFESVARSMGPPDLETTLTLNAAIDRVVAAAVNELSRLQRVMLETVIEQSPIGIIVGDESGNVQLANEAARRIHGRDDLNAAPEERAKVYDLRTPDGYILDAEEVPLQQALHGMTVCNRRVVLRRGDGSDRLVEINAAPLVVEGEVMGGVVNFFDKTDETASNAQRDELLLLQERFMSILGHDLKAPLAAIQMSAEMLLAADDDSERYRAAAHRAFGRIHRAARRMTAMINDLLDVSRARTRGRMPVERDLADLQSIVAAVVDELGVVFPERKILLRVDGNTEGCWDSHRLSQLATNLLANAAQHGTPGPVRVEIAGEGEDVRLSVWNAGVIDESVRKDIFNPYVRATTNVRDGLGLGLYIARAIAEAHGGTLELTSNERQGTTFEARLPREAGTCGGSARGNGAAG